jgi:hypothetical protein
MCVPISVSQTYSIPFSNIHKLPKNRKPHHSLAGLSINSWQRPTLPYRHQHSTIGPAGLIYSVRNGKRSFTRGIVTRKAVSGCQVFSVRNVSEEFHPSRQRRDHQKRSENIVGAIHVQRTPLGNRPYLRRTVRPLSRTVDAQIPTFSAVADPVKRDVRTSRV